MPRAPSRYNRTRSGRGADEGRSGRPVLEVLSWIFGILGTIGTFIGLVASGQLPLPNWIQRSLQASPDEANDVHAASARTELSPSATPPLQVSQVQIGQPPTPVPAVKPVGTVNPTGVGGTQEPSLLVSASDGSDRREQRRDDVAPSEFDAGRQSWSRTEARRQVMRALESHDWRIVEGFCSTQPCVPVHEILGEYSLLYSREEVMILAAYSREEDYDCRGCSPHVSLFEFRLARGSWHLSATDIAVLRAGELGLVSQNAIKVFVIGDNRYGVVVEHGWMGQGVLTTGMTIYTRIAGFVKEVANISTGEDHSGLVVEDEPPTSWTSRYSFRKNHMGLDDLIVTRTGQEKGVPVNETLVYKFNGQQYVTSPMYQ